MRKHKSTEREEFIIIQLLYRFVDTLWMLFTQMPAYMGTFNAVLIKVVSVYIDFTLINGNLFNFSINWKLL